MKPGDSCINQTFFQLHVKFTSHLTTALKFDVCFLMYRRHDDLIFKLIQYTISGNLLQFVKSFLKNRKQRIVWKFKHHLDLIYSLVSLKDLFLVYFFSWFISVIYQMIYPQTLNYLLMIHLFFWLYLKKISNDGLQKMFLASSMENIFLYSKLNFEER